MGCCGNRKQAQSQEACVQAELSGMDSIKTTVIRSGEVSALGFDCLCSIDATSLTSAGNSIGGQLVRMKSLQPIRMEVACFLCKAPLQATGEKYCFVCSVASSSMPLPNGDGANQ